VPSDDEPPAYQANDELSRIFAGAMGLEEQRATPEGSTRQRRRHRRDDDQQNDVLARLLGRS
jgi:hypothetical protein